MTEPATVVTTVATTPASLTTMDNLFSTIYQFFDQYRTSLFLLTGTCTLFPSIAFSPRSDFVVLLVVTACLFNKLWVNRKFYSSTQSMNGKTVLITGGNAGIGYQTAKDLLIRGLYFFSHSQ